MRINRTELRGSFEPDLKFKARHKFENVIEDMLRDQGRVPVVDENTEWFTSWDDDKQQYDFVLVMYGVYVGKRKAKEEILGWDRGKDELIYFG